MENSHDENTNVVSAILMSLSTGVFLHVTFLSLIPSEFSNNTNVHCGANQEDEPLRNYDPFNKEEGEVDKETNTPSRPASFLTSLEQNEIAFTSLKALFFVCGWVTLALLTLLTSGHHH